MPSQGEQVRKPKTTKAHRRRTKSGKSENRQRAVVKPKKEAREGVPGE